MTTRIPKTILVLLAVISTAFADPVTLTNGDAARLMVALRTIQPGLPPAKTRAAAQNINALRPYVEILEAVQTNAGHQGALLRQDAGNLAKVVELDKAVQKEVATKITVNLVPFEVTDDEIDKAKIAPDPLAELLRFLEPKKK